MASDSLKSNNFALNAVMSPISAGIVFLLTMANKFKATDLFPRKENLKQIHPSVRLPEIVRNCPVETE